MFRPIFNYSLMSDKMKEYIKISNENSIKRMMENNKKQALTNCFLKMGHL